MSYEIPKEIWHECKICNKKIKDLAKIYGGGGIYYVDVFLKHLEKEHNLSRDEYFTTYTNRPDCPCNICKQKSRITIEKKNKFKWSYVCGRTPGTMKWSEEAKISRLGKNNPMFGKEAWNKNLTAENNEIMKQNAEKRKGRITSEESKKKQSESAKKRKIHGHTGYKHSDETKEKFRQITLKRIKDGLFKQNKTKPYIKMTEILNKINIKFEEEKIVSHWSFDLYLPEYDYYLEVDGDYWHSNPKTYPNGPQTKTQKINYFRDGKKNKYCEENNLKLIRFWESDILNEEENIICKLKELFQLDE